LSSENYNELRQKIETWLKEEYPDSEIVLVPNNDVHFQIRLKNNQAGLAAVPTYLTLSKLNPDRLVISFYWQLDEQIVKSLNGLKQDAKNKFYKELQQGFLLMNLYYIPEPNWNQIEKIKVKDQIILDGLTKNSIIISVMKINSAHGFIYSKLDLLMDQGFEPYRKPD
jgi:hypothetical protein